MRWRSLNQPPLPRLPRIIVIHVSCASMLHLRIQFAALGSVELSSRRAAEEERLRLASLSLSSKHREPC